jgi:hypothetical protein
MVYLAGPMAAWPFERRFRAPSAIADLVQADTLIESSVSSTKEQREYLAYLKERTWNVLDQDAIWRPLSALAELLVSRETLLGTEALRFILNEVKRDNDRLAKAPSNKLF